MNVMNIAMRLIPLTLALASGLVFADGSGTFYNEGKAIALKGAYAYRMADPFDKAKQITRVVFADKAIDAGAVKDANDRDSAIDEQLRGATRVDLNLEADGSVQNVNLSMDGYSGSQSGSGWYTLSLKHNDDKRIEGHFQSNDEADKKSGRYYDLTFALDLPGAPDLGAALPAGGGDAGKAYLAYLAALKKGDIDALAKLMTKARADELLAVGNNFLHETDAVRFCRIELVARQNPSHGIAPAHRTGEANRRPTKRKDGARDLDLTEPRGLGGHHDVAREHEFDSQGETRALHRHNDRLRE
jgi:hypothetical protein